VAVPLSQPPSSFQRIAVRVRSLSEGAVLAYGALFWLAFSVVIVWVRGPAVDQDLVPAQILAGAVHYPPGHPHDLAYRQSFNLFNYLLAGLWTLLPNPVLLSVLRNCVFAFLSTFVPFALTVVLTRGPWWGLVTAIFSLSQAGMALHGSYPMIVYPEFERWTYRHIYRVLIMVSLLAGRWKWGGFLLALLPVIHPTMGVIIWPWSLVYLWFEARRMAHAEKRQVLLSIAAGLVVCASVAAIDLATSPKPSHPAPYDARANGELIYKNFEATTDVHRFPLSLSVAGYTALPIALLGLIGALLWKPHGSGSDDAGRRRILSLLTICILIWLYVFLASAYIHRSDGAIARWIRISMPGRFFKSHGIDGNAVEHCRHRALGPGPLDLRRPIVDASDSGSPSSGRPSPRFYLRHLGGGAGLQLMRALE
jgi:hypothetical protein